MKKFALLAVVVGSLVAADVAQAGVFRRGGGCPGGVCGVSAPLAAAAPAAPPAPVAEKKEAKEAEVAGPTSEAPTGTAAEAAPASQNRLARLRGIGRRR